MDFTQIDGVWLSFAILASSIILWTPNPFPYASAKFRSVRRCRSGLVLLIWGLNLGYIGWVFFFSAFMFGAISTVQGRPVYGIVVMLLSLAAPFISRSLLS